MPLPAEVRLGLVSFLHAYDSTQTLSLGIHEWLRGTVCLVVVYSKAEMFSGKFLTLLLWYLIFGVS